MHRLEEKIDTLASKLDHILDMIWLVKYETLRDVIAIREGQFPPPPPAAPPGNPARSDAPDGSDVRARNTGARTRPARKAN